MLCTGSVHAMFLEVYVASQTCMALATPYFWYPPDLGPFYLCLTDAVDCPALPQGGGLFRVSVCARAGQNDYKQGLGRSLNAKKPKMP